jgi:beta-lactamase superfamily II metal-dependent hydrolase
LSDFFEIDFLDVETDKSGDAIALRYELNGATRIHVVDGGFQETGEALAKHINEYYGNPNHIDHVVATHPDGDHAGGLRTILEEFQVGALWMLRPWLFAGEIIGRFENVMTVENLQKRLKTCYPNIAALETIAQERNIPIFAPFQGTAIGAFTVLAPTKARYLDLVVTSERTPESTDEAAKAALTSLAELLGKAAAKVVEFAKAAWGVEVFASEETSPENEMSVVQYASLCNNRLLLTADAGLAALSEAADYVQALGVALPGVDRFQVPHHGSRRNVSTEVLDRWLGPRLKERPAKGQEKFTAIISSAKKDEDHPRKAVVRAMIHRGAKVIVTEGKTIQTHANAPVRPTWVAVEGLDYPDEQEQQ